MKIQPSNLEIGTDSTWTIFLAVPIPMELECYVKIYYPSDLVFTFNTITAQGFFRPPSSDNLSSENMEHNTEEKFMVFEGCNKFNGVGEEPYGRLIIDSLRTPGQIKDSGSFKVEIYKDQGLTKKIAYQDQGGFLDEADLLPGYIFDMTLKPEDPVVGKASGHRITFTTTHPITDNGKIVIYMPPNMDLG